MDYIKKLKSKLVKFTLKKNLDDDFDSNVNNNYMLSSQNSYLDKTILQNSTAINSNSSTPITKRNNLSTNNNITVYDKEVAPITIIIPAYNEESSIGYTLSSLFKQSVLPEQIIVVDDSSSDRTSEIAKSFEEVTVVKTPKNSGSKGHALNYGLHYVKSKFTIAMDADITLEENAVKKMIEYMEAHPDICATCTFVLPKNIKTIWDHTRFVEYIFALSFYKSVQQMYDSIIICSGCFTIYKTNELKLVGGWPTHTIAEDMELTMVLYEHDKKIGYNENTFCFAVEPENLRLLAKQLKRWNIGFFQVLKLKWKAMKKMPVIREFVIAGLLDTFIGITFNAVLIYYTIYHHDPSRYLYFIILDIIMLLIPSLWIARKIKKISQLLKSLPIYLIFRFIGSFWFFYGLISVFIIRKSTIRFEKGHN